MVNKYFVEDSNIVRTFRSSDGNVLTMEAVDGRIAVYGEMLLAADKQSLSLLEEWIGFLTEARDELAGHGDLPDSVPPPVAERNYGENPFGQRKL